jgi:hypothetical protein
MLQWYQRQQVPAKHRVVLMGFGSTVLMGLDLRSPWVWIYGSHGFGFTVFYGQDRVLRTG